MESKIIQEIDSYDSRYYFKIGILFSLFLIFFFLLKNITSDDSIPFVAQFNYVEGININAEVQLAGIKIGDVNKIRISPDGIIVNGYIERKYDIPEDSIIKIKSDGIFGRKALSILPGFGEYLDKSNKQYVFNQTQDSYSVDMFLRFLNELNE